MLAADSEPVTDSLLVSVFSLSGTRTLITLPSTASAGVYQVKVNTSGVTEETPVHAAYLTGSAIRAAVDTDGQSFTAGATVVLSVFLFDGAAPLANASVEAFIADDEDPEATPIQVTMLDSGPQDAAPGDGIYTGVYTAATPGKFIAAVRATGTTANGVAYARTASADFRVLPPLAQFISFSDAGVDDNGNGLIDRVAVTANIQTQQAGNYRLEFTLAASNGREARAAAEGALLAGAGS